MYYHITTTPVLQVAESPNALFEGSRCMLLSVLDSSNSNTHACPYHPTSTVVCVHSRELVELALRNHWPVPAAIVDMETEEQQLGLAWQLAFGQATAGQPAPTSIPINAEQHFHDPTSEPLTNLHRRWQNLVTTSNLVAIKSRARLRAITAAVDARGIPVDVSTLKWLLQLRHGLAEQLVDQVPAAAPFFHGGNFSAESFLEVAKTRGCAVPLNAYGKVDWDPFAWTPYSRNFTEAVETLRLRRLVLSLDRLGNAPEISENGRWISASRAFHSNTGRTQPFESGLLGCPSWYRYLITPAAGTALARLDFKAFEFVIAAALSGDPVMLACAAARDPYREAATRMSVLPTLEATFGRDNARARLKRALTSYPNGVGAPGLRTIFGNAIAPELFKHSHAERFRTYDQWAHEMGRRVSQGPVSTPFGWVLPQKPDGHAAAGKFGQAIGASVLNKALVAVEQAGIRVVATHHDSVLIEARADDIDRTAQQTHQIMCSSAKRCLPNVNFSADTRIVRAGERLGGEADEWEWAQILAAINSLS